MELLPQAARPPERPPAGSGVLQGVGREGAPQDVLSRHCLTLAALMDSVISLGPLFADRQSGRRWQVKNTLLARRLRWGLCSGN